MKPRSFDAHVHMGYFPRVGYIEPFYYSPRRVLGVLNRCGVDEFVVSSTCAQITSISIYDLNREAQEMKRLSGHRAHVFLWVSSHIFAEDPSLTLLSNGLYEGIKLHEGETPWMKERKRDLSRILSIAEDRCLPVQFHSAPFGDCCPSSLAWCAEKFPKVRFDFAHCRNMPEMARVMADHPNVWTDTAYMPLEEFPQLADYDWHGRLLFGSDLPVWQARDRVGLTAYYRKYVQAWQDCVSMDVSHWKGFLA